MRPIHMPRSGPVALMATCGEGNTPTAVPSTPDPQYSFPNNPDNGNPRITRYGATDFAFSRTDPKTGLRATHTSYSLGSEPGWGPGEALDPLCRARPTEASRDEAPLRDVGRGPILGKSPPHP